MSISIGQPTPQASQVATWDSSKQMKASFFVPDTAGGLGNGLGNGGGVGFFYPGGLVSVTTDITLDETTYNGWEYYVDNSGGNRIFTLPAAATVPGKVIHVSCVPASNTPNANTVTITANGSEPIGLLAATTFVLRNLGDRVTLISTGSATLGWRILQVHRGYSGLLYSNTAASTAVTGGTSGATTGTGAAYDINYTIPIHTLKAGDLLRIRGMVKQTGVNSSDTMQLALLLGSTTVVQTAAVAGTSASYGSILAEISIRDIGASGHMIADAVYALGAVGSTTKNLALDSTVIDTTATKLISIAALYSSSSASNTSRLDRLTIERIPASVGLV